MQKFIIQISIVLLLVVSLPVVFILINRTANLSENEEIVQRVFDQQLETILFTINQNSENVIVSWINQIDFDFDDKSEMLINIVDKLFQNNSAIYKISFYNADNINEIKSFSNNIDAAIDAPDRLISQKLERLLKQNYQKIEKARNGEFTNLYFMLKSGERKVIGVFLIHTATFIGQNLRPGIQQISQGRFDIGVIDSLTVTGTSINDTISINKGNMHQKDLVYFPGYSIQIKLQNATISELVQARSKQDNYLFIGLLIIVFLGITFVIFSIQKEVKLAELKSEFVSNVSHEIRTPLALISMYAETLLLKRVKSEEKKNEYLKVINYETNRLTSLVNTILSFSKMEHNKRIYQFSLIDINTIIIEVADIFDPHFKSEKVTFSMKLDDSIAGIKADKESVTESIINLIDNAIKYGKKGEKNIEIRTIAKENSLVVEVEDDGVGIAQKHFKQIFDKFYRITSGNLAHIAKGSGLGLNIVQQIMKKHNGSINVQSKVGKGSCFSLIFPQNNKK